MKPIVETVLRSGLVDRSMADLMEHFGMLPAGSSEKVDETALQGAGREKLVKVAESIAAELEREHKVRETAFDLERMRWPAIVGIAVLLPENEVSELIGKRDFRYLLTDVPASVDRFGRYYFRAKDIPSEACLVPGNLIAKKINGSLVSELIIESQRLFLGEDPVCWQVTVQ